MKSRLWQWLVFFFTRPIRLSDLSSLASRMMPRAKPGPLPLVAAAAPASIDTVPTMPAPARARKTARAAAGPSIVPSMFRPELETGVVSEQPLDSLPAELRDELQRPSTGRL